MIVTATGLDMIGFGGVELRDEGPHAHPTGRLNGTPPGGVD